nr:hypothetical protein [Clostridia bacterium]
MGRMIDQPTDLAAIQLSESHEAIEMYRTNLGIPHYINIPHRYLAYRVMKLAVYMFILGVFSYRLFLIVTIPQWLILFLRASAFAGWCTLVGYSKRKVMIMLAVLGVLMLITGSLLRPLLYDIFILKFGMFIGRIYTWINTFVYL